MSTTTIKIPPAYPPAREHTTTQGYIKAYEALNAHRSLTRVEYTYLKPQEPAK